MGVMGREVVGQQTGQVQALFPKRAASARDSVSLGLGPQVFKMKTGFITGVTVKANRTLYGSGVQQKTLSWGQGTRLCPVAGGRVNGCGTQRKLGGGAGGPIR